MSKSHSKNGRNDGGSTAGRSQEDPRTLPLNQPDHYDELTSGQKSALWAWIEENFKRVQNVPKTGPVSSYSLKHYFEESEHGSYVTNGQFKGAMVKAGHNPVDEQELNWRFRAKLVQDGRR